MFILNKIEAKLLHANVLDFNILCFVERSESVHAVCAVGGKVVYLQKYIQTNYYQNS